MVVPLCTVVRLAVRRLIGCGVVDREGVGEGSASSAAVAALLCICGFNSCAVRLGPLAHISSVGGCAAVRGAVRA